MRLARAWLAEPASARSVETADERIAWYVVVATVPAAIAGAAGESFIEKKLGEPWQIAILLAVFAILLWIADRVPQRSARSRTSAGKARSALGLAQCLALMPGDVAVRRHDHPSDGFWKLGRDDAARLSFLLLIPIVFGAAVLEGSQGNGR